MHPHILGASWEAQVFNPFSVGCNTNGAAVVAYLLYLNIA